MKTRKKIRDKVRLRRDKLDILIKGGRLEEKGRRLPQHVRRGLTKPGDTVDIVFKGTAGFILTMGARVVSIDRPYENKDKVDWVITYEI